MTTERCVLAAHEIDETLQVGNMQSKQVYYPKTCSPQDNLQQLFDTGMDLLFPDVQCKGEYPYYMKRFFEQNNVVLTMQEGDEEVLKKGIIIFVFVVISLFLQKSRKLCIRRKFLLILIVG